jgi:hypothetical protein
MAADAAITPAKTTATAAAAAVTDVDFVDAAATETDHSVNNAAIYVRTDSMLLLCCSAMGMLAGRSRLGLRPITPAGNTRCPLKIKTTCTL